MPYDLEYSFPLHLLWACTGTQPTPENSKPIEVPLNKQKFSEDKKCIFFRDFHLLKKGVSY